MKLETMVFQVTTRCPFNCPQCYMQKGQIDLPIETGMQWMRVLRSNGGHMVQFTGGEPMVYPQLSTLIHCATQNELCSAVATSGYGHSIELYEKLKNHGLSMLCVSINDIDETQNAITRDTFEVSLAAIKTACEVGLDCCANIVVTDQNIDNLNTLSQYLINIGIGVIVFLRPVQSFDKHYVPSVSAETIQKMNQLVETVPEMFIVENCFKEYWECMTDKKSTCRDAGEKMIFVNADGTLSPCSQMTQFRYNSMEEIIRNRDIWKGGCCR